jgi:hypothetical protein
MRFWSDLRLLVMALWLGAAVFFIAVAQAAFSVVPERDMAGAVVGRSLSILNYSGIAVGGLLLLASLFRRGASPRVLLWTEWLLLAILAAACAANQFVIGLMIASVRSRMEGRGIDEFALDDPLRLHFNSLHEYSVWILAVAMGAALLCFFVMAARGRSAAPARTTTSDPFDFSKEFRK